MFLPTDYSSLFAVYFQNGNFPLPQGQPPAGVSPYIDPYYIPPTDSFKTTTQKTKFLELLMIVIPIVVSLVLFSINFDKHLKDNQKVFQIQQVIQALRLFYQDSSNVEMRRTYPVSLSSTLNEVDYEYTLQRHLTGLTSLNRHAYILPSDFPSDPWGTYSQNFTNRPVPYKRLEKLPFPADQNSYPEGFKSCNFNGSNTEYARCYLYSSSGSGDSFSLAYYSEVRQGFVIYSETRNNSAKATTSFQAIAE